jgi:hypothetical protein
LEWWNTGMMEYARGKGGALSVIGEIIVDGKIIKKIITSF